MSRWTLEHGWRRWPSTPRLPPPIGNLDRIERWCRQAAAAGAELVLFPELSLTGFVPNHPTGDHATWLREVLAGARAMEDATAGPHMLVADLERAALMEARAAFEYMFRFRRPELYRALSET